MGYRPARHPRTQVINDRRYRWYAEAYNDFIVAHVRAIDILDGQELIISRIAHLPQDHRTGNTEADVSHLIEKYIVMALDLGWQPDIPKLPDFVIYAE